MMQSHLKHDHTHSRPYHKRFFLFQSMPTAFLKTDCNFLKIWEHLMNHCTDKSFHQPLKHSFFRMAG